MKLDIEKLLGEGAIPSPRPLSVEKNLLTTGFLNLDKALGGGIPKGSMVEIVGETGKTTLVLGIMAEHPQSLYINCDYAFDEYYASLIGISKQSLIVNPVNLFKQLEMAINKIPLIIVDSAAGIITGENRQEELEYWMGTIGLLNKDSVIIFTNQFRWNGFKTVTNDNHAFKRNMDVRILIEPLRKRDDLQLYTVNILRNKFNPTPPPIQLAQYVGEGFSKEWDMIDYGLNNGYMETNGVFIHYIENGCVYNLGRGLKQAINYLKNEKLIYKLWRKRMLGDVINGI